MRSALIATLSGASLYSIFWLIDKWLIPNPIINIGILRMILVIFCLGSFTHISVYKSFFLKHYKVYILSLFLIIGLGAELLIYLVKPSDLAWHLVYASLIFVIMGIFLGTYLNTVYELALSVLFILIFLYIKLAVQHVHLSSEWPILVSNLLFLFSSCFLGVLFQLIRNHFSRLSFLNHRNVLKDKETILSISGQLEARKIALEKSEQRFKHLALYDPLTQLPNRRLIIEQIKAAQESSAIDMYTNALLFIDLDKFKQVNDTYGHNIGDALLREMADRFGKCIRKSDSLARLGGDEFVVLLDKLHIDAQQAVVIAQSVADKILKSSHQTMLIEGHTCQCGVSIGIKLFQGNTITPDELLAQADKAMYEAKRLGRNNVQFYN